MKPEGSGGAWMVTSDHEGGGRRHAVHAALHHADVLPAVLQLDVSDQHVARRALSGKHAMSTFCFASAEHPEGCGQPPTRAEPAPHEETVGETEEDGPDGMCGHRSR